MKCECNCGHEATTTYKGYRTMQVCQECFNTETRYDYLSEKYRNYGEEDLWEKIERLEEQIKEGGL